MDINIIKHLTDGFERLKKNFIFHIIAVLIISVVQSLTLGLLAGPLLIGYFNAMDKEDRDEAPEINDLFANFDLFLPSLIAILVSISGLLLCGIGVLLTIPIGLVALVLVKDGEKDGIKAVSQAWKIVKPRYVSAIFAFFIAHLVCSIASLLVTVGATIAYIGMLLVAPISITAMYKISRELIDSHEDKSEA